MISSALLLQQAEYIVIKIGSVLVAHIEQGTVKQEWLDAFARDVKNLTVQGKKVIVVSSGAVALGRKALGIPTNVAPETIRLEQKQAASAVGQFHLFHGYHDAFDKVDLKTAQVLLTMSETENRRMHLNARETLHTLMDKGIVPVINENDTVSTGEIRFGDNDRLAVRVAQMVEADAVVLLSTIDGLYTADPNRDKTATHIPVVDSITDEHIAMAGDAIPGLSTGGMKSKIQAAIAASRAGIALVIANGKAEGSFGALVHGAAQSTMFCAATTKAGARKRWIQTHMKPKGIVVVDDGALQALGEGKSLLPIGVKSIDGAFDRGDPVHIRTLSGKDIGIGLSAYSAENARQIIGKKSKDIALILGYTGRDELIHRDDMALNS